MDIVNAPLSTLLTSALNKPVTAHRKKSTPSLTTMNESTKQTNMGLLSSFSVITQSDTTKTNTLLHKHFSMDNPSTPSSSTSLNTRGNKHASAESASSKRKPSELKFKMESIGAQPEEDDDLDMCPARTRAVWPRQRQLVPWWQPSQPKDKPPYSYATLIAYAILISQDGRLLLSDIYRWISETYPYYILENRGWQNSIRHNLSLNKKWFLKVDRRPTQANPGKGCYWTLVPGTEQMFMENITEAGGHNRKHHDIGLTAELSMGHRNNLMVKHHYHSSSHSSGGSRQPGSGATFSNANMKITRPEDYQQQARQKSSSSSSSASHDKKSSSSAKLSSSSSSPPSSLTPAATPKSCKPVAAAPSLGPMYSTFRMTSTTMESVSQESQDTNQKKMKRQCTDDDDDAQDDLDMITNKRAKFNPTTDDMMEDYLYMDAGDNQSDCDSGVDISNELLDGKKNITTTAPPAFSSTDNGLALPNEEFGLYNVLDHFLDQLPLPLNQSGDDNPLFNYLYPTHPTTGFPWNPSDVDPVLGYPSFDYYSMNGFFYDANSSNINGDVAQVPVNDVYPTLLTSRFDPPPGDEEDASNKVVAPHNFRSSSSSSNSSGNFNKNDCRFGNINSSQQQTQATKGPLVIHLNGAPGVAMASQGGGSNGGNGALSDTYGMDEEMADAYLKFEDDEVVLDTAKDMAMGLDCSDMTAAVGSATGTADCAFRQNFLDYSFTNMCDLLES